MLSVEILNLLLSYYPGQPLHIHTCLMSNSYSLVYPIPDVAEANNSWGIDMIKATPMTTLLG